MFWCAYCQEPHDPVFCPEFYGDNQYEDLREQDVLGDMMDHDNES